MSFEILNKPDKQYRQLERQWLTIELALGGKIAIDDHVLGHNPLLPSPAYKEKPDYRDPETGEWISGNTYHISERRKAYWQRASYLNAASETLKALNGFIWSRDADIDADEQIGEILITRDVQQSITNELLSFGRAGILIVLPNKAGGTIKETLNSMPTLLEYSHKDIIFVKSDDNKLIEVRLRECAEVQVNEFEWEDRRRIRRLFLDDNGHYAVQLWDEIDGLISGDGVPLMNGSPLDFIPFFIAGSERNGDKISKPPLYDLAEINLKHYGLSADWNQNLHYHGNGILNLFIEDSQQFNRMNPFGLDVGADGRNVFGANDRAEILQLAATNALPDEMVRVESRMVMLGAMLVKNQSSTQTLGAKKIEFGAATSTLKQVSLNASEMLTDIANTLAMILGIAREQSITLNLKFLTDDITAQELQVLMQSVISGLLPQSAYWQALRDRGFTALTDDELQEEILDQQAVTGTSYEQAQQTAAQQSEQE